MNNNPLLTTDPDGRDPSDCDPGDFDCGFNPDPIQFTPQGTPWDENFGIPGWLGFPTDSNPLGAFLPQLPDECDFGPCGDPGFGNGFADNPNQIKNVKQQCLQQFYSSGIGKAVEFESVPSLVPGWNPNWKANFKQWTEAIGGKGGGVAASGIYTGTEELITLNQVRVIASTAEIWAQKFIKNVERTATKATILASGLDIIAHAGCGTIARQASGQMTPLPPGWASSL